MAKSKDGSKSRRVAQEPQFEKVRVVSLLYPGSERVRSVSVGSMTWRVKDSIVIGAIPNSIQYRRLKVVYGERIGIIEIEVPMGTSDSAHGHITKPELPPTSRPNLRAMMDAISLADVIRIETTGGNMRDLQDEDEQHERPEQPEQPEQLGPDNETVMVELDIVTE